MLAYGARRDVYGSRTSMLPVVLSSHRRPRKLGGQDPQNGPHGGTPA